MKPDYNLAQTSNPRFDSGSAGKASVITALLKFPANVLSNELSSAPRYRDSCKFLRSASVPELGPDAASALFHLAADGKKKEKWAIAVPLAAWTSISHLLLAKVIHKVLLLEFRDRVSTEIFGPY